MLLVGLLPLNINGEEEKDGLSLPASYKKRWVGKFGTGITYTLVDSPGLYEKEKDSNGLLLDACTPRALNAMLRKN
ncbi:unnamed protein product [Orchesella dallaii]|uniref:Uncharacterized protein n=1 Tax=Orchesella dallaii TaxID=48710 RepID=A0ABP1RSJ8_9HEXA